MTQDVWIEINDKRYCIPKGFTIKARYEYMSKYGLNENWKFKKMEDGNERKAPHIGHAQLRVIFNLIGE